MLSSKKIVVFKVDDENFAADIMQVERILSYTEPTKVPESPVFVKGVIKYQEKILPVIDLKKRLNLKETTMKDDPKIIVVSTMRKV
jgi:purine-binding chemotaxis protein CheW